MATIQLVYLSCYHHNLKQQANFLQQVGQLPKTDKANSQVKKILKNDRFQHLPRWEKFRD